ncbi:Acyl-coenzyme A thioesterase 2, chloroplastic, partial [Linum grandiflorum]
MFFLMMISFFIIPACKRKLDVNPIPVVSMFTNPFDTSNGGSSSARKPIALWPGMYHSPVTNALWEARSKIFDTMLDPPKDAPPQTQLLTKSPDQSRTSIHYNFSSDYILREQYRDPWNKVRIGKLLEDLDALHYADEDCTTRPLLLVTASFDRIVLKKPISMDVHLKIVGSAIWVGRSSIEILFSLQMTGLNFGGGYAEDSDVLDSVALTANFIFVARDSQTGKAAQVNRLVPETNQEKLLFEEAEAMTNPRKRKRVVDDDRKEVDGSGGEISRLKALLAEGRVFCDMPTLTYTNNILLRDTHLENSLICQPHQRNMHSRIFGGFLMHRTFELAFSTSYAFAGSVPYFLEVDHVDFLRPVDVGDFLRLKSCVLCTELENPDEPVINVEVVAH